MKRRSKRVCTSLGRGKKTWARGGASHNLDLPPKISARLLKIASSYFRVKGRRGRERIKDA